MIASSMASTKSLRATTRSVFLSLALVLTLVCLCAAGTGAATLTVTTLTDSGAGSLRAALAAASPGDTIRFAVTGTITLTSGPLAFGASVTIDGPGANLLTIDGNHATEVFTALGSGNDVTISGLTIANGSSSTLTLVGGIAVGGAETLTIVNCAFAHNSGSLGGAIFSTGTLTVTNSTFLDNSVSSGGFGGAINIGGGTAAVTNSTFLNNSASSVGGAINTTGPVTVANSTFSGNSAQLGGAINVQSGVPHISYAIFDGNSATMGGAIFDNQTSAPIESNNLFFNNTILGSTTTNDVSGFTLSSTDLTGKDPMLAPLGNYGGTTGTQTLLPLPGARTDNGSAAICAGPVVPGTPSTDQRGFPRPTSYTGVSTPCLDIGAVQTNYQSVQFTNATGGYSASVNQDVSPPPIVSVTENGQNIGGVPITLSFIAGAGTASGLGPVTTVTGTGATFSALTVSAVGFDQLSVNLNLNPTSATPALSISTSAPVPVQVTVIPTSTSLQISPGTIVAFGTMVTFTATVTSSQPGLGVPPTGVVTFSLDGIQEQPPVALTGAGRAVFSVPGLLPVGTHLVIASYSGDTNFARSSNSVTETVNAAQVTLSLPSGLLTIPSGGSGSAMITVGSNGTLASAVTLSCPNPPAGFVCAFSQNPVPATNLQTSPATPTITVSATGLKIGAVRGAPSQNSPLGMSAMGWYAFAGLLLSVPLSLAPWGQRRVRQYLAVLALMVAAGAALAGCANNGSVLTNGGDVAAPGTYTLTVAGTSGTSTQSATMNVVVH